VVSKYGRLLEERHELQMFKNQMPIKIFVAMRDEVFVRNKEIIDVP
jgi:hypothetical protein